MDNAKKVSTKVWIVGLLLTFLFVAVLIWYSLESVYGSDDPADITRRMYIGGSAILLFFLFAVFGWQAEKADKMDLDNKIQAQLGLKPISRMELFTRYINMDRFYVPHPQPRGTWLPRYMFHGEYNGYEICISEPGIIPMFHWYATGGKSVGVHIKSSAIHFPKFTIRNKWYGKYYVQGDQKAQMQFVKPHILNFFKRTHRFAVQGNGNEFLFHEINCESKNYKPIIEHAFIVLKLLTDAAPFSRFSEIGKLQEECKRPHKSNLLWWPGVLIAEAATVALVYLLLYR